MGLHREQTRSARCCTVKQHFLRLDIRRQFGLEPTLAEFGVLQTEPAAHAESLRTTESRADAVQRAVGIDVPKLTHAIVRIPRVAQTALL